MVKINCPVCGATIEFIFNKERDTFLPPNSITLPEPEKITCDICNTQFDLRMKTYPSASETNAKYYKRWMEQAYEERRAAMSAKWNKGELLEKIREKQEQTGIERVEMRPISVIPDETLSFMDSYLDQMILKMRNEQDMYLICELARQYILDEQAFRKDIVHCCNCIIKKAVQHKDGMVWRCPHRTDDVKMEGYCECGRRGS